MKNIKLFENYTEEENESSSYQVKLNKISKISKEIYDMIDSMGDLPAWAQDKITISEHNMVALQDYLKTVELKNK